MKVYLISIFIQLLLVYNLTGQKDAYTLYDSDGNTVNYNEVLQKLKDYDIILFGELHNNAIAHWLQYEVTKDLHDMKVPLVLGAEMIEADDQEHLNLFLQDSITYKGLDTLARLWSNHKTDYAPLVKIAKDNKLPFVATNIPRRYANMVYRKGFEVLNGLSDIEKSWMAPLPMAFDPELPTYQKILVDMGDHGTPELVMAQATKDATMAYFISQNLPAEGTFIHYNGRYHSDFHEGIVWYLGQIDENLRVITITTVTQENIYQLEDQYKGSADYIICVDSDMTTTY